MRKPRPKVRLNDGTVAFKHRNALKLLTMANHKTPKGESAGWLSAILYLHPHDSGGGKTLCPHSTPACREMCLAGAGLSALPRAQGAKQFRTDLFLNHQEAFLKLVAADIATLKAICGQEGLRAAVRLNGTSDILWERLLDMSDPHVRWYDYSKIPIELRTGRHPDYHLTYSIGGPDDIGRARSYLAAGHSVAVVVPEDVKSQLIGHSALLPGSVQANFIDGDKSDLRFLDPPSSIVLLKPKGYVRTELVRPNILQELQATEANLDHRHELRNINEMARPIEPMIFPGIIPAKLSTTKPEFRWVDPSVLLVDENYQRHLSRSGVNLIEKIVEHWDWARFKPPVVAETEDGLEVIDGQHTATAAATHPRIETIPVMIVRAKELGDRAKAFVGHNRDRLMLSQVQIHFASVTAGDEDATTIQQVCDRVGVKLLRYPPGNGAFNPGETLAVAAIRSLVNRRFAAGARSVLQVLADANCAPVRADGIKAVEAILFDPEYRGQLSSADLTSCLLNMGPKAESEARVFAAAHNIPLWRALAVTLFREAKRGRRRSA